MAFKLLDHKREPILLILTIISAIIAIGSIVGYFVPEFAGRIRTESTQYNSTNLLLQHKQTSYYYDLLFLQIPATMLAFLQIFYFGSRYFYTGFLSKPSHPIFTMIYSICCILGILVAIFLYTVHNSSAFWLGILFIVNLNYSIFYLISWFKSRSRNELPK